MKHVSFLLILGVLINSCYCNSCTDEDFNKADDAMQKVMVFGDTKGTGWAKNKTHLAQNCDDLNKNSKLVREFAKKCLNAFDKQVMGLLLRGVNAEIKNICFKLDKAEFINNVGCANIETLNNRRCYNTFVKQIKAANAGPDSKKMPFLCCTFNLFEKCVLDNLKKQPECTAKSLEIFKNLIHGIASGVLDLSCNGYQTFNSNCEALVNELPSKLLASARGKSVLLPIMDLVKGLN